MADESTESGKAGHPTESHLDLSVEQLAGKRRTKAQEIAAIFDEPEMRFVDWEEVMGEGVVVHLSIRRVRFRKKTSFEELGLHFADAKIKLAMEDIFRLGMKNLLPKSYILRLESIESSARKLLQHCSFETIWGPFLPVTGYRAWKEKNQELMDAYYAQRDEILKNYPTIKKQVISNYTDAARNAYRILHNLDPKALSDRELEREAYYLAGFRLKIRKMLPSPAEISETFDFVIRTTYIDLPILLQGDSSDESIPITKRTIEGITTEEQRELRWLQAGTKRRQEMMEEMNRDVVEKARAQKERYIDSFLTTVITQLRSLIYDSVTNVLYRLKVNESLQPRSVVQLKNLVEQLGQLNFYNDRDAERIMKQISTLIDRPHEERDLELIEQRLREIGTVMRGSLLDLDYEFREEREDSKEAELEREKRLLADIAARPSKHEVREARMSLGLELRAWDDSREERLDEEVFPSSSTLEEEREERTWS